MTYFASYADDNTTCIVQKNTSKTIKSFEEISKPLIEWFKDNEIKLNPNKCHLIFSYSDIISINVGDFTIKYTKSEKLIKVSLDNKFNFQSHMENLCSYENRKLHAMSHKSLYMDLKKKILMNAFFDSLPNYCPLVRMRHSRTLNSKINKLHEGCIRVNIQSQNFNFSRQR